MTGSTIKAAARSYFERFADLDLADAIFLPGVRFHYPLGDIDGRDALKRYLVAVRAAFPDIRFDVEDLFSEDDLVAARWTLTGTQTGEFRGKPGTGKAVTVPGNTVFRFRDGKIFEMWVAFDPARLL